MKSCPHCSASLEEDAVRCRRCGKWVVGERDQRRPNKKAGRTRKRLLILGAMVLLAWALWGIPESTASDGVNLSLIATPTGWSASATHEEHPPEEGCAVYGGSASPPRSPISPAEPGVIECTGK
jgi:ribosomal protein L40E